MKRILILSAHPDDSEFGAGGTIAKLAEDRTSVPAITGFHKHEVMNAVFSRCTESLPNDANPNTLMTEWGNAGRALGLDDSELAVTLSDIPVRRFNEHRQDILESLVRISKEWKPTLAFTTSLNSIHQDHRVLAEETLRAFRFSTILAYEFPWDNMNFHGTCLSKLSIEQLETKIKAIQCYESQQHRGYSDPDFISSLARVRGRQANTTYAECFEVVRWMM